MTRNDVLRRARPRPGDVASTALTALVGCVLGVALLLVAPGAASAAPAKLDLTAACAGNTVSGTVQITGVPAGTVVTVRAEAQTSGWSPVGVPTSFVVVSGKTSYTVTLGVAGVTGAKSFRLTASVGPGNSATSNNIKATDCAPPAQVPEVPAPLLIPVSMVFTAACLEGLRRRRVAVTKP